MKLSKVQEILDAKTLTDESCLDTDVFAACGCDLMSDVLAFVKNQALLLTGLVNQQVVRTADMMDIRAIMFVRGKVPTEDIIQLAKDSGIALLTTDYPLYVACGKLYSQGLTEKEQ